MTDTPVPEWITALVRETMQDYGNAATDGRPWNINTAMRFAEEAVKRATRASVAGSTNIDLPKQWPRGTRVHVPDPTRKGQVGRISDYIGDKVHVGFPIGSWFGPLADVTLLEDYRDVLGRVVRDAWVKWAKAQPTPKPSWLVPYDDLSEPDKEADRQIGEALSIYAAPALPEAAAQVAPAEPAPVARLIQKSGEVPGNGGAARNSPYPLYDVVILNRAAVWDDMPLYASAPAEPAEGEAEPVAWLVSAPSTIFPEPRVFQIEIEADAYLAECKNEHRPKFTKVALYPAPDREAATREAVIEDETLVDEFHAELRKQGAFGVEHYGKVVLAMHPFIAATLRAVDRARALAQQAKPQQAKT
jgi:hypothetical protein